MLALQIKFYLFLCKFFSVFIFTFIITLSIYTQVPYGETNFRAPLNIPLVLAGNFAELRSNHFHTGLDIKTNHKQGYRIYAIDSGYVSRINISHWGYGKAIYVTHSNGYTSVYAHLRNFPKKIEKFLRSKQFENETETIDIQLNATDLIVSKGEIIAYSGNSGSSSAPHLHFEIRQTESEDPVNPLLFNFDIKDNIKPSVFNLKVYPIEGSLNNEVTEKVFQTTGSNGNYTLKNTPILKVNGKIGFGIHTIDRLNAANNKCGIYTIELSIDNQIVFKQTMEKIDFSTNRYINAHKDYYEYHKKRRSFHKSFVTENNDLVIYSDLINKGFIHFSDNEIHNLKYIIKDSYGNTSYLKFKVQSTSKSIPTNINTKNVTPLNSFTLLKDDFIVEMEEKTLYESTSVSYSKEKTLNSSASLHHFGNSQMPLQKYFVMRIKTQGIPANKTDKAVIVKISDNKKRTRAKGGTYKNGWIETKVRDFGNYTVKIDSLAPVIVPINISEGANISSQKTIQFKITDNLSGIKSYKIYIDKKFMLSNYKPRKATLTLTFDAYNKINKGKHFLKIIVSDERENRRVVTYEFNN